MPSTLRAFVLRAWLPSSLLPSLHGNVHIDLGGWAVVQRRAEADHAGVAANRRIAAFADAARRRHAPDRRCARDWVSRWR